MVSSINGPDPDPTFALNPLIKRLKPEDGSVVLQEHGEEREEAGGIGTYSDDENSSLSACDLIDNGVAAIFGPSSKAASGE